ncbi:MAG: helix-turn-helix transcriptional regulator [Pseudomonadota bacterium]
MTQQSQAKEISQDQAKELRRTLGLWLKQRREDAKLTQADLADRLGLRYYSFVSQVENGIGRIPQHLYEGWAKALQVDRLVFGMTILEHLEPGLYAMIAPALPQGGDGGAAEESRDPA